jgi:hypothetical protein
MTIDFDSNNIPSRQEREERVLDLHFNQNKNYRQIAREMKMSLRDIGALVTVGYDTGQYIGPDYFYISQNHRVEMFLEEA